jgi:hypothetical protein
VENVDWLTTYHRRTLRLLDSLSDTERASRGDFAWGETGELSRFCYEMSMHDAEHAEQIWQYGAGGAATGK